VCRLVQAAGAAKTSFMPENGMVCVAIDAHRNLAGLKILLVRVFDVNAFDCTNVLVLPELHLILSERRRALNRSSRRRSCSFLCPWCQCVTCRTSFRQACGAHQDPVRTVSLGDWIAVVSTSGDAAISPPPPAIAHEGIFRKRIDGLMFAVVIVIRFTPCNYRKVSSLL
jgi:hypothetical protein